MYEVFLFLILSVERAAVAYVEGNRLNMFNTLCGSMCN